MPGILSSVTAFENTPLGASIAAFTANLSNGLDALLIEASADVEGECNRKLQAGQPTTVASTATQGANSFVVANCAGIYDEDVVAFPSSAEVQQVIGCDPDTSSGPPYKGTVYINGTLTVGYEADTVVQVYRQCKSEIRGHQTSPMNQSAGLSPAGQLAEAHAPSGLTAGNARRVPLAEKPSWSLFAAYQTLPWTGADETLVELQGVYLKQSGLFELPIGFYNPVGSKWRVQYTAGYIAMPQDIIDACHLYLADKVTRAMNPMGALNVKNADEQVQITPAAGGGSAYIQQAQCKLQRYKRRGVR
jgi:hypothetical protein